MKDRLFAGVSLAVAGGYYALATRIPRSDLSDATGPSGLPITYAALLGLLALVLLVQSLVTPRLVASTVSRQADRAPSASHWRPLVTLAVGVGYVVLVPTLGYAPAIAALIATGTLAHGGRLTLRTVAIAVVGAMALWVLFVWFLGIRQPEGWWPFPSGPAETA